MKTTLGRDGVLSALRKAQAGLSGACGANAEMYNCFRFTPGKVLTYNNEIAASVPLEHDLDVTVPADELRKILEKASGETVTIEVTDTELQIIGGKFKAGIALRDSFSLPPGLDVSIDEMHPLPDEFNHALKQCAATTYAGKDRADLNCVHIAKFFMESCDVARITRWYFKDSERMPFGFLLPLSAAKALMSHPLRQVAMFEDGLVFEDDTDVRLYARTVDHNYPKLDSLMVKDGSPATFPKSIGSILERADVFSSDQEGERCFMVMEDSKLTVYASGARGWFKEEARMTYKGPRAVFACIPAVLKDIIKRSLDFTVSARALRFELTELDHWISVTNISQEDLERYIKLIK